MDILYMGYFCNEDMFNKLVENGSKCSHARQQFERKLLCGLMQNMQGHTFQMISYLPVANEKFANLVGETYQGYHITYLWCSKKLKDILIAIKKNREYIKRWMGNRGEDKIILTYSANPLHCIPAMMMRKKYGYKIVTICSEVSIYRRNAAQNPLSWLKTRLSYYLENNFDGYVFLSKYMEELVNKKSKPYIVMEGFGEIKKVSDRVGSERKKVILYAGGLSEDNGIKILVEGFKNFPNQEWELWICGVGDLEGYVNEQSDIDSRIKYFGLLPNAEVQEKELKASFLINPRFSNEEFTKYSFPSKILEYMSTGTPTIITRLKGIPEEYFENVIVLENESADGIKCLLEKLDITVYEEYDALGKRALRNIVEKKTPKVQGRRILNFLADIRDC